MERAYLCATETLARESCPDEADRLGIDEKRTVWTSCSGARPPPPPVEKLPWEPEEPSRDDPDIGLDAVEQTTPLEGAGETASINPKSLTVKTAGSSQFKRARFG